MNYFLLKPFLLHTRIYLEDPEKKKKKKKKKQKRKLNFQDTDQDGKKTRFSRIHHAVEKKKTQIERKFFCGINKITQGNKNRYKINNFHQYNLFFYLVREIFFIPNTMFSFLSSTRPLQFSTEQHPEYLSLPSETTTVKPPLSLPRLFVF